MKDALGVANYFIPTAHDAGNMPLGMASDAENSRTLSPEATVDLTSQPTSNGCVADRMDVTAGAITPARHGITDEQAKFMARIKNTRSHGYMLTMEDADILIRIIEELTK